MASVVNRRKWIGWTMGLVVGALLLPLRLVAREHRKTNSSHRRTHKSSVRKVSSGRHPHPSTRRPVRRWRRTSRYRHRRLKSHPARQRLESGRVEQIQTALAKAGYLHEDPNGKWDDATHDAMRRFQQANGFQATGLPEAKALMELGLGPHPLPRRPKRVAVEEPQR